MPNEAAPAEATAPIETTGETMSDGDAEAIVRDMFPTFESNAAPTSSDSKKGKPANEKPKAPAGGKGGGQASAPSKEDAEGETSETEDDRGDAGDGSASGDDGDSELTSEAVTNDELFSDKALTTREGLAAARQAILDSRKAVREERRKAHDVFVRTSRREKRATEREERATARERAVIASEQRIGADLELMANGDASQALDALGRLMRRNGADAYQLLTENVLANGKKPQIQRDPLLLQLAENMQGLQRHLVQSQEAQQRDAWRSGVIREVQVAEKYPALAQFFGEKGMGLIDHIDAAFVDYYEKSGRQRTIPLEELLADYEKQLKPYLRQAAPVAATTTTVKNERRVPRLPGQSPSTARTGTQIVQTREKTEDERFEELANTPNILRELGLE